MARLPRKVREINDFNATDWFEKLLQRTTSSIPLQISGGGFFVVIATVSKCRSLAIWNLLKQLGTAATSSTPYLCGRKIGRRQGPFPKRIW